MDMFKQACWLHLSFIVNRYLMSCSSVRPDGAEKHMRHVEMCTFYVAVVRGLDDPEDVRRGGHERDYQAVHSATQSLTDNLDQEIGFPLKGHPDYDTLAPLFFKKFHELALSALGVEPYKLAGEGA
jgi:hypothetical protein